MDIFSYEGLFRLGSDNLGSDNVFVKLARLIDWPEINRVLKSTREHLGREGYSPTH